MIRYSQRPPRLWIDGRQLEHLGQALYSGNGKSMNRPEDEAIKNHGPIPAGRWRIVRWDAHHGTKGPNVAVLEPVGHDAHGRSAFLIHGDSISAPGTASDGCIVAGPGFRDELHKSNETDLEVTHGLDDPQAQV